MYHFIAYCLHSVTSVTSSSLSPQLPKAKDTAAMSGAGFMRLMKNVGESFSKMATKKTETDSVRTLPVPAGGSSHA